MKLFKTLIAVLVVSFSLSSCKGGVDGEISKAVDFMCKGAELQKEMETAVEKAESPEDKAKVTKEFQEKLTTLQKEMKEQVTKMEEKFKEKEGDKDFEKKVKETMQKEMDKCDALKGMKVPG